MNNSTLMEPEVAQATATVVKPKFGLFTLYGDFPAGIRAKRLMHRIALRSGKDWDLTAQMWKLDSVAPIGPISEMIAEEAGDADVLLFAVSSVEQPDPAVIRWLNTLVPWKANRSLPGLLVGFPGNEERRVDASNWFVDHLAAFARQTGMDLAWHAAGHDSAEDGDWLFEKLDQLLERKRNSAVALPVG